MTDTIAKTKYMKITPAGAFYATIGSEPDDARALLLQLLSSESPLAYSAELVMELTDLSKDAANKLFRKLLKKNFIKLSVTPTIILNDTVEKLLPELLTGLSSSGKASLADGHGFCLGSIGYEDDHAEGLSALAADLSSLHERHRALLNRDLSLMGESWGMLDPVGLSQVGFWVIHLGHQRFMLVIDQMPKLNQQNYVDLLSILARRYLDY